MKIVYNRKLTAQAIASLNSELKHTHSTIEILKIKLRELMEKYSNKEFHFKYWFEVNSNLNWEIDEESFSEIDFFMNVYSSAFFLFKRKEATIEIRGIAVSLEHDQVHFPEKKYYSGKQISLDINLPVGSKEAFTIEFVDYCKHYFKLAFEMANMPSNIFDIKVSFH